MTKTIFKRIIILVALVSVYSLMWATAGCRTKDPLLFPKDDFTVETKTVMTSAGEKKVTYRSYMHIPYVAQPVDKEYQSLNVCVPIKIDDKDVDATNAPILMANDVGGFMKVNNKTGFTNEYPPGGGTCVIVKFPALAAGYVVVDPGCRGSDNKAADGTYYGKAPAGIVDLKAAVRYIKHNKGIIPGNVDWIVSSGCSAGGALSSLLGSAANNHMYDSFLEVIGAADADESIFACACYSPVTDLAHRDMASAWMLGEDPLSIDNPVDQGIFEQLTALFAEYQVSLNLKGKDNFGTITAKNLDKYILQYYLIPAASRYLRGLTDEKRKEYLEKNAWITWSNKGATFTFSDFVAATASGIPISFPSNDSLDLESPEARLFGNRTTDARHFTDFGLQLSTGDKNARVESDLQTVVNMMNPMYFIGQKNPGYAKHWWIRAGSLEHNVLVILANLATGLENMDRNMDVNAALFWEAGHCQDDDMEGFIAWIGDITGFNKKK